MSTCHRATCFRLRLVLPRLPALALTLALLALGAQPRQLIVPTRTSAFSLLGVFTAVGHNHECGSQPPTSHLRRCLRRIWLGQRRRTLAYVRGLLYRDQDLRFGHFPVVVGRGKCSSRRVFCTLQKKPVIPRSRHHPWRPLGTLFTGTLVGLRALLLYP